jgi:hypothetical protein
MNDCKINAETLNTVLSKMLGEKITRANYQAKQLHGGTVGDVLLVTGQAETADAAAKPFNVVLKITKKWERYADPGSWRREYDLYASNLDNYFLDTLKWPECYYMEITESETRLWLEYIEGTSGLDLTGDMYETAAEELGRFQGKLYALPPTELKGIANVSGTDAMEKFYRHYKSWEVVYGYIRSGTCEIPRHLCDMLITADETADEVFRRVSTLPVVLCHSFG